MRYYKERYGLSLEFIKRFEVSDRVFAEMVSGIGVVHMSTLVPSEVSQRAFVNGLSNEKNIVAPALIFSWKLGYLVF
jgi:hypothetical protein